MLASSMGVGSRVWTRVSGTSTFQLELRKAQRALHDELSRGAFSEIRTRRTPASLAGGGFDGDAVWMLSARDPVTGQFMRKTDGTPFWQRNVIFYPAVPLNDPCPGGADADGYDDRCPHKVLVEKVVDRNPATVPGDESSEETLLTPAEVVAHLTRPNGSSVQGGSLRAQGLLTCRLQLAPRPEYPREVRVDLRAVSVVEARKKVALGTAPLGSGPYTTQNLFSAFPALP
jgi:hypothetical protein